MNKKPGKFAAPLNKDSLQGLSQQALFEYLQTDRKGLTGADAESRYQYYGPNTIHSKSNNPLLTFLSFFWGPIPWMIEAAALLSALVHNTDDLIIILVLLIFNAVVGFWQAYQAGNAIEQLKKQLALKSKVCRDGKWIELDAGRLVPGDRVNIRLGDIVPADMVLIEGGYLSIDQSALTGESLPVNKNENDLIYSGSIVKQGDMTGVVVATGASTYFGRTARLVGQAKPASHFQQAVLSIGDYLIFMSMALVAVLILVGLERHWPVMELIQFALILTVASIPVAMPAVLSVTMAVGATRLAKLKAIVSRLESIEELAGMDVLCSDKTGTLTQNKLTLGDTVTCGRAEPESVLTAAALASEQASPDAIDAAILQAIKEPSQLSGYRQTHFMPFDPVQKRTEAAIEAGDGTSCKVSKGAPQVILALCQPDQDTVLKTERVVAEFASRGYRALGIARTDTSGKWVFLGVLSLFDPPRDDARETITQAKAHGIQVKMVTGDNIAIARQISAQLGLGQHIIAAEHLTADNGQADGYAQVFPEHKYQLVRNLQHAGHLVGMTGDGVNDAPALKQADVGIAVTGATDAARAAADIVLTAPGLSVIVTAIDEAKRIFERMNSYAIYRISETLSIMIFMVLAIVIYNTYPITAVMIIMLALLNDIPILTIAKDRIHLPEAPVHWEMRRVLTVATVLGLAGVVETFLLFIVARNYLNLGAAEQSTLIFLELVIAGHLTLFIARTKHGFLSRPYPAPLLLISILATQIIAVLIAGFGWFMTPVAWRYIGLLWAYCLVWLLVGDALKLMVYRHLGQTLPAHRRFFSGLQRSMHFHWHNRHYS